MTAFFLGGFYFFYKYFRTLKKIEHRRQVKAKCTDFIIRTFYNKKEYVAFYEFDLNKEKWTAGDKTRLPFIKYFIKNNNSYVMYVNPKNEKDYISPYVVLTYKYYLILAILAIVIPLLLLK